METKEEEQENIIPLEMNLAIMIKNDRPALELRKIITQEEYIKTIILSAFYNTPIIIQPTLRHRTKSLASLLEKGILYHNKETNTYDFNI